MMFLWMIKGIQHKHAVSRVAATNKILVTNKIFQNSTFFYVFFGDHTSALTAPDIHAEETQDTHM